MNTIVLLQILLTKAPLHLELIKADALRNAIALAIVLFHHIHVKCRLFYLGLLLLPCPLICDLHLHAGKLHGEPVDEGFLDPGGCQLITLSRGFTLRHFFVKVDQEVCPFDISLTISQ